GGRVRASRPAMARGAPPRRRGAGRGRPRAARRPARVRRVPHAPGRGADAARARARVSARDGEGVMASRLEVRVTVNGEARAGMTEPRQSLADFLRDELDLTGTHLGCEHGVCGACTVIVDGRPARSCLLLAVEA